MISKVTFLFVLGCMTSLLQGAPLAKRMVDLTHTFDETTLNFPGGLIKKFQMNVIINGSVPELNDMWLQSEKYSLGTHAGTHMDAPLDVIEGGKTIEQLEVAHFIAPAAVVDISAKGELNPDAEATTEDLLQWESITGQSLNDTILLLRTGWGKKWGNQTAYFGTPDNDPTDLHFPGLSGEAAQWLVDNRSILGIGIDTLSYDKGSTRDFPAHKALLGQGIFGLENVANMEEIPIYGAKLYVMPMKIGSASGAPVRIIATFPEVVFDRQLS